MMSEEEEKRSTQPSSKAAYMKAMRAEEKAEKALELINDLHSKIDTLITRLSQTQQPVQVQAQGMRPGQMIHNVIAEDDEGITEEVICPTCGTREVRKIPNKVKIEVKEKPIIPDNYIPAPRSISEFIDLLESLKLPDGRSIFESQKFYEKLNEYLQRYGYTIQSVKKK